MDVWQHHTPFPLLFGESKACGLSATPTLAYLLKMFKHELVNHTWSKSLFYPTLYIYMIILLSTVILLSELCNLGFHVMVSVETGSHVSCKTRCEISSADNSVSFHCPLKPDRPAIACHLVASTDTHLFAGKGQNNMRLPWRRLACG